MAKSQAELIREVTATVNDLAAQLVVLDDRVVNLQTEANRRSQREAEAIAHAATTDAHITQLRTDVSTLREDLRRALDRLAASEAKNAALEERSRHHEKTADRGWQLWLAALGFGFGLVSLLVTAALQLKK